MHLSNVTNVTAGYNSYTLANTVGFENNVTTVLQDESLDSKIVCPDFDQMNSTAYQIRSYNSYCTTVEETDFIKRAPADLEVGYVDQYVSGSNTDDISNDSDDDTLDQEVNNDGDGGVISSNPNPNDWMVNSGNEGTSSPIGPVNEYTGMGIEDDNYLTIIKDSQPSTPSSQSSESLNHEQEQSVKQQDRNIIPTLKVNHDTLVDFDQSLGSSSINLKTVKLASGESSLTSTTYESDSSYESGDLIDFRLLPKPNIQSSQTEPYLNSFPHPEANLDPFELTQSDNNMNSFSNAHESQSSILSNSDLPMPPLYRLQKSHSQPDTMSVYHDQPGNPPSFNQVQPESNLGPSSDGMPVNSPKSYSSSASGSEVTVKPSPESEISTEPSIEEIEFLTEDDDTDE